MSVRRDAASCSASRSCSGGADARDLAHELGGVGGEPLPQMLHHRAHDHGAARRGDLEAPRERRLEFPELEGVAPAPRRARRLGDFAGAQVVDVEDVVAAAVLEIGLPQEAAPCRRARAAAGPSARARRPRRSLPRSMSRPRDAECQRRVAARPRVHPERGVNGARGESRGRRGRPSLPR